MRVVTASIIGLCFMISPVWAVEVTPAPVAPENQTAPSRATAATVPRCQLERQLDTQANPRSSSVKSNC